MTGTSIWFINYQSSIRRPSTPYPRDRIPSPCIKKPIHKLQYLPTASQYSPTVSQYRTPPESPEPKPSSSRLSPTFIPEVLFLNPNFLLSLDGRESEDEFHQWLEEQYLELSTDERENIEQIERQINAQVQELERQQVELDNSWRGIGTWYNPIIIEDDWFRESLDVRGVILWLFSSMNTCQTCLIHFHSIISMHCFMDKHFTFTFHFHL